jgi:hypothetical protein
MGDYELHADYDRNGRLSATGGEYGARATYPGAVLLANLDADARSLPATVSNGAAITLDWEQTTKTGNDNDPAAFLVRVARPSAPVGSQYFLAITGWMVSRVKLYDRNGRRLQRTPGTFGQYPLTFAAGAAGNSLDLRLEASTLAGSPLAHPMTLATSSGGTTIDEARLQLNLFSIDPSGQQTFLDRAVATIAPFVIPDNSAVAERIYICTTADNEPSVMDLQTALAQTPGVALVTVPDSVSAGDSWLQDQFQHGFCQGPGGTMHVVVHLPRLRSNVVQAGITPNLATFVTSHFPSRNLGLFQDFWRRSIPFQDARNQAQQLPFEQTHEVLMHMQRVFSVRRTILDVLLILQAQSSPPQPSGWSAARIGLRALLQQALQVISHEELHAQNDDRRRQLDATRRDLQRRVQQIDALLPLRSGNVSLPLPGGRRVEVTQTIADQLFNRLRQMHDSVNYGGNIEASAPMTGAPLGKIVVGNATLDDGSEIMDPDLLRLLRKQNQQPLVEVDTTWLDVGHVDELFTFVPASGTNFAALRASPGLARELLRAAHAHYVMGLPLVHPDRLDYRPAPTLGRAMASGQAPVTFLLRGKLWLHHHPQNALQVLDPPLIYRKMADVNARWPHTVHDIPYWRGEGVDRQYHAGLSVNEALYFERDRHGNSVNAFIESNMMTELDRRLAAEFPGVPILKLPVLFDAINDLGSWADGDRGETTAAFTPNLVNLQVINGHLFIPRPYGPRMKAADAVAVLREVLVEQGLDSIGGRVNERALSNRGLTNTVCWMRAEAAIAFPISQPSGIVRTIFPGISNAADVAQLFRDGFPGANLGDVEQQIRQANRQHFDANGSLRPGWRRLLIPENTVDLFQAYTQMVVESLNLRVQWVDSWYYHVRFGEIHCGTNVIRRPAQAQTAWWSVNP